MMLLCLILSITYFTSNIHKRGAIRKRDHQTGILLLYDGRKYELESTTNL